MRKIEVVIVPQKKKGFDPETFAALLAQNIQKRGLENEKKTTKQAG